jgi:hypothetical protein
MVFPSCPFLYFVDLDERSVNYCPWSISSLLPSFLSFMVAEPHLTELGSA